MPDQGSVALTPFLRLLQERQAFDIPGTPTMVGLCRCLRRATGQFRVDLVGIEKVEKVDFYDVDCEMLRRMIPESVVAGSIASLCTMHLDYFQPRTRSSLISPNQS